MIQVLFPKISFFEILSKFYKNLIKFKGKLQFKQNISRFQSSFVVRFRD